MLQLKNYTVTGLADSDGSYCNRLLRREDNKLGVSLCVQFTQKTANKDVLELVSLKIGSTNRIIDTTEQGIQKSRLDIYLDTEPGTCLLKLLKKCKPLTPGKRRDYLISLKLLEYSKTRTFKELKVLGLLPDEQELVASEICVHLRYGMTNQSLNQSSSGKTKLEKDDWINWLQLTAKTSLLAKQYAGQFIDEIEQNVTNLEKYLRQKPYTTNPSQKAKEPRLKAKRIIHRPCLPEAYIVGFHIGDGCCYVGITFDKKCQKLSVELRWSLDESSISNEVLTGIQATFNGEGSIFKEKSRTRYKITGAESCSKTIIPLLQKYPMPPARQAQFQVFAEACLICEQGLHLSLSGLTRLIKLVWSMNTSNRKISEKEMLKRAETYCHYNAIPRSGYNMATKRKQLRYAMRKRLGLH
jgi:hypothetical protein